MPLLTKPLTRQERRAVELRRQGMDNNAVADEMCLAGSHVRSLLSQAKRKGAVFPALPRRPPDPSVPIARIVKIRADLIARGFPKNGMSAVIAERVGLTKNCVKVRLWRYDQEQKRGQAA